MKKEVNIRKATIKDFKLVYNLKKIFVNFQIRKYKLSIVTPDYVSKLMKDELKKEFKDRKTYVFLIEKNNKAIGFTEVVIQKFGIWVNSKKGAYLSQVFILPKYRGKGYCSILINYVFDFLKSKGCDLIKLCVHPDNPAEKLYSRKGFKTVFIEMYKRLK